MPRVSHRTRGGDAAAAGRASPWEQLLAVLDALRAELAANCVPAFLQRKLYVQLFSFINVQLFNQLLLRRECCSFANGEYVKNGLAQVRRRRPPHATMAVLLRPLCSASQAPARQCCARCLGVLSARRPRDPTRPAGTRCAPA